MDLSSWCQKRLTPLSLSASRLPPLPGPSVVKKWLDRIGEIERRETAMRLRYQIRSDANAIHTSSQPGSHHHSILYLHLYPKCPCRFRHPQSLYDTPPHLEQPTLHSLRASSVNSYCSLYVALWHSSGRYIVACMDRVTLDRSLVHQ